MINIDRERYEVMPKYDETTWYKFLRQYSGTDIGLLVYFPNGDFFLGKEDDGRIADVRDAVKFHRQFIIMVYHLVDPNTPWDYSITGTPSSMAVYVANCIRDQWVDSNDSAWIIPAGNRYSDKVEPDYKTGWNFWEKIR